MRGAGAGRGAAGSRWGRRSSAQPLQKSVLKTR